jgi:hypothetical protein
MTITDRRNQDRTSSIHQAARRGFDFDLCSDRRGGAMMRSMKKLHTFNLGDNLQLELLKSLLERNGIEFLVKSEHMFAIAGGVPFTECYPELWIMDDRDFDRASKLIHVWLQPSKEPGVAWRCETCLETIEGQFDLCWNCQASRPDEL